MTKRLIKECAEVKSSLLYSGNAVHRKHFYFDILRCMPGDLTQNRTGFRYKNFALSCFSGMLQERFCFPGLVQGLPHGSDCKMIFALCCF